MLNIDVDHPDILDFIDVKTDLEKVKYANISVNMTKEFMEAVENDEEFDLEFYVQSTGETIKNTVNARELFRKLAYNNWDYAEPGILFQDRIDSWHLKSEYEDFEFHGVNPCAEQTLGAFGSCNLASINLSEFVKKSFTDDAYFDIDEFEKVVREGVVYLNEILDENEPNHPLKQQREMARDYREIGLGIMGMADMFIKMGIVYGSTESIIFIDELGYDMLNFALQESAKLAKEDGTFPKYDEDATLSSPFLMENASDETIKMIAENGLRNSQLLTIAPTGSISTMFGVSGGIEAIFQVSYNRRSETLYEEDTIYKVFTPIAKAYMEENGITKEEDLPETFVTSSTLDYKDRIHVQAQWQEYIDASISSTVNVPNEFTVEEVEDLYMYAWEQGLKGITIFRDGCARLGILTTDTDDSDEPEQEEEECST